MNSKNKNYPTPHLHGRPSWMHAFCIILTFRLEIISYFLSPLFLNISSFYEDFFSQFHNFLSVYFLFLFRNNCVHTLFLSHSCVYCLCNSFWRITFKCNENKRKSNITRSTLNRFGWETWVRKTVFVANYSHLS